MSLALWSAAVIAALVFLQTPARAHDGGFGHSRRTLFLSADKELRLEYRIIQNRDEALVELIRMDADADGRVSDAEKDRYFTARAQQVAASLFVRTAAGDRVPLKFVRYELSHTLGQTYHFTLATTATEVLLDDRVFPHKPGLVQVRHGPGLTVEPARPANLSHAERVQLRLTRATP